MRLICLTGLFVTCCMIQGVEPPAKPPDAPARIAPRTPAESLKAFEIHPDFRIELVAAEPLVMSPVAAEFDEDGRLFVCEAPEYNQYGSAKPHGQGRVVMLEDTDKDGTFDKRTVIVNLDYPTGLFPWNGGLYIGAAPYLYYWKDGKLTAIIGGFGSDKAGEGQLNSFRWGIDNHIHISTGLDGGELRSLPEQKGSKPVNVRRRNVIFDPRNNDFRLTSGGGQHGMSMDDWGRTFVCGNSDPCQYLAYDDSLLEQFPAVQAPPPLVSIAPEGKFTRLHRISEVEPWRIMRTKLRKEGAVPGSDEGGQPSGFFTGATGITIYRGDAYPAEFKGNAFVGEVANNLVYRAKLIPKGTSFVAERADKDREFLASRDSWFRPVQFLHGPDGCLYVIDMYRELIEGAAFLAPPILKTVDPSAGVDRGRVWRIVPKKLGQANIDRRAAKLSRASVEELVKLLDHSDGWQRDTVARLLNERWKDENIAPLRQLLFDGNTPQGRAAALALLMKFFPGMHTFNTTAIKDRDSNVRALALLIAYHAKRDISLKTLRELAEDGDPHVRQLVVWNLLREEDESIGEIMRSVIRHGLDDPATRLAVLTVSTYNDGTRQAMDFLDDKQLRGTPAGRAFMETVVETAGARHRLAAMTALRGITRMKDEEIGLQFQLFAALCRRASPDTLRYFATNKQMRELFSQMHERAVEAAVNANLDEPQRVQAIRALQTMPFNQLRELVTTLLKPTEPRAVQVAMLEMLSVSAHNDAPEILLKAWPTFSPAVRATATEVFLSRANWMNFFLDAVEAKKIARADIDPARIALLKKSPNRALRLRVEELFAGKSVARQEIIEQYQKALALKGDAAKGKLVFKNSCANCHKLDNVGEEIGADLKAIRDRGLEGIMLNILDPNREVKPQFIAYQLETTAGRTLSGMLSAETAGSVTIRLLDGRSETVSRANIESLRSTGVSFMPEGLEKTISVEAMADLLAYLMGTP